MTAFGRAPPADAPTRMILRHRHLELASISARACSTSSLISSTCCSARGARALERGLELERAHGARSHVEQPLYRAQALSR
jgi:hypothetical protein